MPAKQFSKKRKNKEEKEEQEETEENTLKKRKIQEESDSESSEPEKKEDFKKKSKKEESESESESESEDEASSEEEKEEKVKKNEKNEEKTPTAVFVRQLPFQMTENDLFDTFKPYGNVEKVDLFTDKSSGRSKGMALVTFSSEEEANEAIKNVNETEVFGRTIYCRIDKQNNEKNDFGNNNFRKNRNFDNQQEEPEETNKVFISGLSYETTAENLVGAFEEFGTITDSHLFTDKETGDSKGLAVITFSSVEEAKNAIENMNESELDEKTIYVKMDNKKPGGRGGRGGRGGFRGGRGRDGGFRGGRGRDGGFRGGRGRGGFRGGRGRGGRGRDNGFRPRRGGFNKGGDY